MSERPMSGAAGGVSFDVIVDEKMKSCKGKPPARLAKLDKQKKKPLSEKEIKAKLEQARIRREKQEQEKLDKIQEVTKARD